LEERSRQIGADERSRAEEVSEPSPDIQRILDRAKAGSKIAGKIAGTAIGNAIASEGVRRVVILVLNG